MRGNTVGSANELHTLITDREAAYIFGLWCADGYWWSSSIGITSVNAAIADRFKLFLARHVPENRIKLRTYYPVGAKPTRSLTPAYTMRLARQPAYQLYVNSRLLLRLFNKAELQISALPTKYITAYFAGRFDGDGSVDKNLRNDLRICYSNRAEAATDEQLLARLGRYKTRLYQYRKARTHILYVSRKSAEQFLRDIAPHSIKVQSLTPRRDLSV